MYSGAMPHCKCGIREVMEQHLRDLVCLRTICLFCLRNYILILFYLRNGINPLFFPYAVIVMYTSIHAFWVYVCVKALPASCIDRGQIAHLPQNTTLIGLCVIYRCADLKSCKLIHI